MASSTPPQCEPGEEFDFLCVDAYIRNVVEAQALKAALSSGLIDQLQQKDSTALTHIEQIWKGDHRGLRLLLDLLAANHVIERDPSEVRLTKEFRDALRFRDLMEAKLDFANLVAPDLLQLFPSLLVDPGRFVRESRVYNLFGYQRCLEPGADNYAATRRFMRFTTCLTRYEAHACMRFFDFGRCARMLDVGGNSGEFILQVCRQNPHLRGTVFDLPLVCDIGQDHVRAEPEANRIAFVKGNALVDPLPKGFDLITFKSVLHDWSDEDAKSFLVNASQALEPGGTLLIFERTTIDIGRSPIPYSMIPMLLFFRLFRSPSFYQDRLQELGFVEIEIRTIRLEMPFHLIAARRPG